VACISYYFIGFRAGLYIYIQVRLFLFGLLIMNVNVFITATAIFFILLMPIVLYKKYFKEEIRQKDFYLNKYRGILVLVTCSYGGILPGTEADRAEMELTFKRLGYNVVQLCNEGATKSAITTTLIQLSDYLSRYCGPTTDRALVFAFSGHGRRGELVSCDRKSLSLMNDILRRFVKHPGMGGIPKLFFIDACRGSNKITKSLEQTVKDFEATTKGLSHEEGNFLIAHATIVDHVSYDSYWMHKLAKRIRENLNVPLTKILDDLAGDVPRQQQPEYTSRLRGSFDFQIVN
jgi:hypothetical protein